jgi:hypothetical protein
VVIKFSSPTPTPSSTPVPGTPTPVPTVPPVGPPPTVNVTCLATPISTGNQIDCTTSFVEAYNTIAWTTTGPAVPASDLSGAKHFTTYGPATGTNTVQAQVCFNSVCTTSNVATILPGQIVTQLQSDVCTSGFHFDGDPINAYIVNWDNSKPYPTGTVTWIVNGNTVGTSGIPSGEPIAAIPVTLGITGSAVPLLIQYTGDANWTSTTLSCVFENMTDLP